MAREKIFKYKGASVNIFGIPKTKKLKKKSEGSMRSYLLSFKSDFNENAPKNLIVMYDIPHGFKKERDWFRRQLVKFGYIMIQKSVWVGPSPLPKDFLGYLKEIKIWDKFKTFRLAKPYK